MKTTGPLSDSISAFHAFSSFLDAVTMPISKSGDDSLYEQPTKGVFSYLPSSCVPYAELVRLDKPIGTLIVYFPYLFGSLFAACIQYPFISPPSMLSANAKLFLMAGLLRCAGCTWNDVIDRDLDRKVARCRLRPMARGAISPRNGYIFHMVQMLILFTFLLQTSPWAIPYVFAVVFFGQLYPFAKRVINYPEVVLGFALSPGVLVGYVVQGGRPTALVTEQPSTAVALACLCLSYLCWTVTHDIIYDFQDIRDDAKAGIKSMCLRYESHITPLLSGLAVAQVVFHIATGSAIRAGLLYYLGTCLGTATLLGYLIWKLDVRDPKECLWWFQYGSLIVGCTITAGFGGEYGRRLLAAKELQGGGLLV